jgi:hypothetical protein
LCGTCKPKLDQARQVIQLPHVMTHQGLYVQRNSDMTRR